MTQEEHSLVILSRRLVHRRSALFGAVVLVLLIIVAVAAPLIAPYDPQKMISKDRLQGPSPTHWMGTDQYGRDTLSRLIYGAQISLRVGLLATLSALLLGLILGLSAGYLGRGVDLVISRLLDMMFSFPVMLLAISLMTILGAGELSVFVTLAIVYAPVFARICRGTTLSARESDYVLSAKAVGAGDIRIVLRHILPNIAAPLIVQTSLCVGLAIIAEAALSFLGVGTPPPAPSWGSMLADGRIAMERSPWGAIFPGLAIMLTVLSLNLLGDGLRDALDPTLQLIRKKAGNP